MSHERIVETHKFNSRWLGCAFGISSDPGLLHVSEAELLSAFAGFDIVELRLPYGAPAPARSRLRYIETQVHYRLGTALARMPTGIEVRPIRDVSTTHWHPFEHERYSALQLDPELLMERYRAWAEMLADAHPGFCGEVVNADTTLGWFFGSPGERHVNFALAVQSRDASQGGLALYRGAVAHFAAMGARSVHASFSSRNLAALSIHAQLGCRFVGATDHYLWVKPEAV